MKIKKEDIKQDFLDQLERSGVTGSYYIDLVNDYMDLHDIKNGLIKDIKERGVSVKYQHGKEQWGYKKNDSIPELVRISGQMLKIIKELGIEAKNEEFDSEDWEM